MPVRRILWSAEQPQDYLLDKEWLVTNGLGGYASGTLAGALTRRYHGLLTAALPSPLGRVVLLNHLIEHLLLSDSTQICISCEQTHLTDITVHGASYLREFRLEWGLPVWSYQIGDTLMEKRIFMPYLQNTVYISYRVIHGDALTLNLRPSIDFRRHNSPLQKTQKSDYYLVAHHFYYQICADSSYPGLNLFLSGKKVTFTLDGGEIKDIHHFIEADRGYDAVGSLWTPGTISARIDTGNPFTLTASCEPVETVQAMDAQTALKKEIERREKLISLASEKAQNGIASELVIAADQFIISPVGRSPDIIRTHASGDELRSVIAGYHWFTDWGRDTMISLEGLTLVTGRFAEAGWILRTFARYIHKGLIPNLFPEGEKEGRYNTADATLWFFHALNRYLQYTGDRFTLNSLLNKLTEIIDAHVKGTLFGIGADPDDGLLCQGHPGLQLTWMDAKVEDWVVTPRDGKAVEINALWYNALKLLEKWLKEEKSDSAAAELEKLSAKVYKSFNKRFWNAKLNYLYDVIDGEQGDDCSCRPNQILAISLDYPVLDKSKWEAVIKVVSQKLLTPLGLRTLSQEHPHFKPKYFGDLRARDAAYHQGTVWAWLIGPFIDAWLKLHPNQQQKAGEFLKSFDSHLSDACIGSVSEIFDALDPFTPRGCIAQAWSVAEVLRSLVRTKT
jgi:predicted glycogen debranching enzyme